MAEDMTASDGFADTAPSGSSQKRGAGEVLEVGSLVGERLAVVGLLGRGGQGDVFEVEDVKSGERMAIKVLSAELSRDARFVKRLEHEAVTASAIDHPNVTRIYGMERTRTGQIYIRMELLQGRPLDELLAEGPLPIDVACRIAIEVARGLGAAHALGIIHRDVKPQNIFIAETDAGPTAKVMDFGIAKAEAQWELTSLTQTGGLVGTPAYMSPEQILMPEEIDHRTDVYSHGLVFLEMLTGRRAFVAKEIAQILVMQTKNPPPDLRTLRPEVPRAIAHVVKRSLEKSPFDRPQSMNELAQAIEEARSRSEAAPVPVAVPAIPPPKPPNMLLRLVIGMVVFASAIGLVVWRYGEPVALTSTVVEAPPNNAEAQPPSKRPPLVAPSAATQTPVPPQSAAQAPENGVLYLSSVPSQAAVFMGRALLGTTPLELALAPDKTHTLQLTRHGYVQHVVDVTVAPGKRQTRQVQLERDTGRGALRVNREPLPPPPPDYGWARVETDRSLDVYVEGRKMGRTPLEMLRLPVGRTTLRFVDPSAGLDATRVIVVRPGELTTVTLDL